MMHQKYFAAEFRVFPLGQLTRNVLTMSLARCSYSSE